MRCDSYRGRRRKRCFLRSNKSCRPLTFSALEALDVGAGQTERLGSFPDDCDANFGRTASDGEASSVRAGSKKPGVSQIGAGWPKSGNECVRWSARLAWDPGDLIPAISAAFRTHSAPEHLPQIQTHPSRQQQRCSCDPDPGDLPDAGQRPPNSSLLPCLGTTANRLP